MGYWGHGFFQSDSVCDDLKVIVRGVQTPGPSAETRRWDVLSELEVKASAERWVLEGVVAQAVDAGDAEKLPYAFQMARERRHDYRSELLSRSHKERACEREHLHGVAEIILTYCIGKNLRLSLDSVNTLARYGLAGVADFRNPQARIDAVWQRASEVYRLDERSSDDFEYLLTSAPQNFCHSS